MNFFLKYWSPIVATLAFLLSLWASYNTYKLTHLKPKALIKWINEVKDGETSQFNICLSVFNGSSKPISIKKIWLNNFPAIDFLLVLVSDEDSEIYSDDLPINVDPFKSIKFVVAFQYVTPELLQRKRLIKLVYDSNKTVIADTDSPNVNIDSREMIRRLNAYRLKKK